MVDVATEGTDDEDGDGDGAAGVGAGVAGWAGVDVETDGVAVAADADAAWVAPATAGPVVAPVPADVQPAAIRAAAMRPRSRT